MSEAVDVTALLDAGFRKQFSDEQWAEANEGLAKSGRSTGGPYRLDYVLKRRGVMITVERNVGVQQQGDLGYTVEYPSVAVVEGPGGRVAVDPRNTDLVLAMAEAVGQ